MSRNKRQIDMTDISSLRAELTAAIDAAGDEGVALRPACPISWFDKLTMRSHGVS